MKRTTRRRVLSAGLAGVAALAGCTGGGSGDGAGDDGGTTTGTTATTGSTAATTGSTAATEATTATATTTGATSTAGTGGTTATTRETETTASTTTETTRATTTAELEGPAWQTRPLTDVRSRNTFRIGAFEKPVLLETFAVWCPACTEQQNQIEKLRERRDDFVAVSLNVDPNENGTKVFQHANEHGFDWRFAVAGSQVTNSLVDQFGAVVTVAPQAPVIRDCGSSASLLDTGVKSADALGSALEEC